MKLELRRVTALTPGAQDARRSWPERQSLLVRLSDARGNSGIGEASPLPGYSPDDLGAVETALLRIKTADIEGAIRLPTPRAVLQAVAALAAPGLPSARMALETAALDFCSRERMVSAPVWLGAAASAERPLSELVGPASSAELLPQSESAVAKGFRHLKLKLGAAGKLESELSGVARVREHLGANVHLRLDANGCLTASELEIAWEILAPLDIELFEEPGVVPESLRGLLPLALDESLQRLNADSAIALLERSAARFAVLKPMALGGLSHAFELAERAQTAGLGVVLSHCFDGLPAWRALAALALALPLGSAHGLAPHAGLPDFSAVFPVQRGSLVGWTEPGLGLDPERYFA